MTGRTILPGKKVVDIHTVSANFQGQILPGEVILSGDVAISVFSGADPSPMDMLDGSIIIDGETLRHRIREGLPGVVYLLVFRATLDTDRVLEIELLQAVLPNFLPVGPIFQQYYFTTTLYPIEDIEGILGAFDLGAGDLIQIPIDGIIDSFAPLESELRNILIQYGMLSEGILDAFEPLESILKNTLISYSMKSEGILDAFEPLDSIIKNTLITYSNYKPEGIIDTFEPIAGTLV